MGEPVITDRYRHTVIEVNSDQILSRDLIVKDLEIVINLSAPTRLSFKISQGEQYASAYGINFKNWGQWIITEAEIDGIQKIIGATIVTDNKVDRESGDLIIETTGFIGYPKGIPWLENFNPIAVDPAEIIQRIWAHCQSYVNSNLGVEVLPSSTGTQMLPGYAFDGNILAFDFFAIFIRAIDFNDCGDQIISLARDLPLDLFEEAQWNVDRTEVTKTMKLAYPLGGLRQEYLAFKYGENVIDCEIADETDIEPVTDILVRSWAPGRVINTSISNADPTRLRRIKMEEDANINSTERAAALAKRKLQKRNIPKSFKTIKIDPNHTNAPFGNWWVGDTIFVEADNYPWYGNVAEWHRIVSISIKEDDPFMELGLKVEGAFNYDPIEYDPDYDEEPTEDLNLIKNGYFGRSTAGWKSNRGQWIRTNQIYYDDPNSGAMRIDCDDTGEEFESHRIQVTPGETLHCKCVVRYNNITQPGTGPGFIMRIKKYFAGGYIGAFTDVDSVLDPDGTGGWHVLQGDFVVPATGVNEITMQFTVDPSVTGGTAYWTYARVLR